MWILFGLKLIGTEFETAFRNNRVKFLVTGGSGFIGTNLIQMLLAQGHQVVNLDKRAPQPRYEPETQSGSRCTFFQRDLCDVTDVDLADVMFHEQVESVIHLAAETHVDRSIESPDEYFESNVLGTFELLKAAKIYYESLDEKGRSQFRFVQVSTDEVFGSLGPEEPRFDENSNYRPNSPYSASKAAGDHFVRAFHKTYGLPTIVSHCSNNFGPYQFAEKLIPVVIRHCLSESPIPIYGDGTNVRDWIHVDDHCRALMQLAELGAIGETYLIGASQELSNLDLIHRICETVDELSPPASGRPCLELIEFVRDRPGHDFRYAVDTSKIKKDLGWEPESVFDESLRSTIQWYIKHPDWLALRYEDR